MLVGQNHSLIRLLVMRCFRHRNVGFLFFSALLICHFSPSAYSNRDFLVCGLRTHGLCSLLAESFLLCTLVKHSLVFFVPQPDSTCPIESLPDDVMIRLHPNSRDGSSQTVYKTEPGTDTCSSHQTVYNAAYLQFKFREIVKNCSFFSDNVSAYSDEQTSCASAIKHDKVQDIR